MVTPQSRCLDCGAEYEHDRFHMVCPECGGFTTELFAGRELQIDTIEVDIPDDGERQRVAVPAKPRLYAGRRFPIGRSRKATRIRRAFPIRFITETAA